MNVSYFKPSVNTISNVKAPFFLDYSLVITFITIYHLTHSQRGNVIIRPRGHHCYNAGDIIFRNNQVSAQG